MDDSVPVPITAVLNWPSIVARDGVVRLDQSMIDRWWNALELGVQL